MWQIIPNVVIVYFLIAAPSIHAESHWTYNNIDKWPGICTEGKLQSPIDLQRSNAHKKTINPLQFENYSQRFQATLKNTKHSVEIRFTHAENIYELRPSVVGGNLASRFLLDHIHFHWGSEHTINGHRFPLEMHMVHFDSRYASISEAKDVKGGLAVFAIVYNISSHKNQDMVQLEELFDTISKNADKVVTLPNEIVPKVFLPTDVAAYYRYEGSLTTPGCEEVVTWTVFTQPKTISEDQAKKFEIIQSDAGPLLRNYRPLQPLNGRQVLLQVSPISTTSHFRPSVALIALFSLFVIYWK